MKAVRLHDYHKPPVVEDVPEPTLSGPLDVIVKIGGAGVCRTDLHIIEGQWAEAMRTPAGCTRSGRASPTSPPGTR
jgi:NAD+-dependent secondary alcohol dehydrogenase Adh1